MQTSSAIDTLSLQDSELLRIEAVRGAHEGGDGIRLVLAASVTRHGEGGTVEHGFFKPVTLTLPGARRRDEGGTLSDCIGRIADGSLLVATEPDEAPIQLHGMPLPWGCEGAVSLRLAFRLGGELWIDAAGARCEAGPDARFFESLAC